MLGEQLKSMEHVDTVHIAYKGSAPALTDLIGGQIQYSFFSPMAVMQSFQQGQVKGIAMLAPQRLPGAEGIPTSAEEGAPGLIGGTRFGLLAPAGTSQAIVDKLQKSVAMTLALPEVQATFKTLYTVPIGNTPEQFRQFIVSETGKWRALGKKLDIELE
jgi:tripartite-type tricarboxylate transporter receptor subunit TctC